MLRRLALFAAALAATAAAPAGAVGRADLDRISAAAPGVPREALGLALSAVECAQSHGQGRDATRLTLIDYSKPSLEPRLWVIDLSRPAVLYTEYVAHGRNSGENLATRFSNVEGSYQTSLGLFLTGETYHGGNGY
jgi:hypothetical protein